MAALQHVAAHVATVGAAVGAGLVAGLCFSFHSFIMRAFDDLGASGAVRAMQSVNARILQSSAMPVWFSPVVLGGLAALLSSERWLPAVATGLYLVGAGAITRLGNIPLNEQLDEVDADSDGAADAWSRYRAGWGQWNALRTLTCALATAVFALAA